MNTPVNVVNEWPKKLEIIVKLESVLMATIRNIVS